MNLVSLVGHLRSELGSTGFVEPANNERYTSDWMNRYKAEPLAVVRPADTAEVSMVVRACHEAGVAVTAQGGNSGLCGGSIPAGHGPSIILSLERIKAIRSIDVARSTATVDAGVTVQTLQEAAAEQSLLFAPDWGARGTAQVGGGIATNAGGLNVLRWGGMREQILGLEVVLPNGDVWDGLRSLRKDATGLDLKQLFIGTEGTLGIVTAAVVRLHPLPSSHLTAFVALSGLESLMPFFTLARSKAEGLVSAFELVPEEGLKRVLGNDIGFQRPLAEPSEWYVLLRLSGTDDVADSLNELLAAAVDQGQVTDAAVALTKEQEENLWLMRDELPPPTTFDKWGNRHKFDLSVPVDRVVDFIEAAPAIVGAIVPGTCTYNFGHVGDGNLHFNIFPGPEANLDDFANRGPDLERAVDELTWSYGGSVSAEHGVGQTMRGRFAMQKSEVELDLMRKIKNALDPNDRFNPGKILP